MKQVSAWIALMLLITSSVFAQPVVQYITPDAGAPGMCVAVEIFAPYGATGSFGPDITYNPEVIVQLANPGDRAKVRLGPAVVSWNGRLIQQMIMIESAASAPSDILLNVVHNGSVQFLFHIVKPSHIGVISGNNVLGQSPLVISSARNTLVVDSLILQNGTFTCTQQDLDASTAGNQAYLPLRILSMGPIRLINATLNANGQNGATVENSSSRGGGSGGPGGGGGGSGYLGAGGNGYTGGGGEGPAAGGSGTGSSTGTNNYDGGPGLSGVLGGVGNIGTGGADEGGGGGTGHPFGLSGAGGRGNQSSPPGGYGAGSGSGDASGLGAAAYAGGGGGYATNGTAGQGGGTANNGNAHGNSMLIPLAGGSGGGSGNVKHATSGADAGSGGGGGGAIELTSFTSFTDAAGNIVANGGNGSNGSPVDFLGLHESAAAGGGGSGGAIGISARDSISIGSATSSPLFGINGGSGGTSPDGNGGNGGSGRVRLNGYVSKVNGNSASTNYFSPAKDFTGPSIQKVTFARDSFVVSGYAEYWDGIPASTTPINILYAWPSSPSWQSIAGIITNDPKSHTAKWVSPTMQVSQIPGDSEIYVVALQNQNAVSSTYLDVPMGVMSHTSGIIQRIPGVPKVLVKITAIDFGKIRVGKCSNDTTLEVYSIGAAPLTIDSMVLFGPDAAQFILKTFAPPPANPGDSITVVLAFCPNVLKCPMNATLRIYTNDVYEDIQLIGCAVKPQVAINPLVIDFGRIRVGECKDTIATVTNAGTDDLTITSESIGDPRFITLDTLPLHVPPGGSATIHLRYCPTDTSHTTTYDSVASDAPESPIILTLIGGGKEGILSVHPDTLDFGNVKFGTCRDTGFYAKNVGNDSLILTQNILRTFVPPLGSLGFQYVSPNLPSLLLPGDSAFIHLRFCSTDTSVATGVDSLQTNYPSIGVVQLRAHTGYGILSAFDTIDFGNVVVGSCLDTIVPFKNIGTDTLVITSIPNLPPVFSVVFPLPVYIAPGATAYIAFRYCPADTSVTTANSHINVDTLSRGGPLTLRGKGIQGALSTSGPIDFGCMTDTNATQSIILKNTGTAPLTGLTATLSPSPDFSIVYSPASVLPSGSTDSVIVRATTAVLGNVSATVTITWTKGTLLTIPVTAHASLPPKITVLDTAINFGIVNVGDTSDAQCIRVTNYSCLPVSGSSISIAQSIPGTFEIVSNNVPSPLADSNVGTICVRFIPKQNGDALGTLQIAYDTSRIDGVKLTGTGKVGTIGVDLAVDTAMGVPGQTSQVAIRVLNDITAAAVTSVTFRVQFDPMQLDLKAPVAPTTSSIAKSGGIQSNAVYSVKQYSIGDQEITATFPSPLTGTPTIAELPFEVLLPTANVARLHLLNASFGSSPAVLSSSSDGAILIQQCDTTDHARLLAQPVTISQNSPNPFNPRTNIKLDVNEAGHIKIEVFNMLGEIVMVPFNEDVSVGTREITIDASALPSGSYRYVTQWTGASRTLRDEKTMVVVK